jgi:[acyl-carrier-protein] S-malonyltransferase
MNKKFAVVFPGQGSQSLGMLAELAAIYPLVETTFAQASAVLGYDLWQLSQIGPVEKLNETQFTQPALLAAGVAVWRIWRAHGGGLPGSIAGHSLGEYTALVCASALDFTDAIKLVAQRGQFMQSAVPVGQGAMAAIIGLEASVVTAVCLQAAQGEILMLANFNSPEQIVIAGVRTAVERAISLAKALRSRVQN